LYSLNLNQVIAMPNQQVSALTEDEFIELDNFLLSDVCDDETLSIDEAHGYLTALQLPPVRLDQAEWSEAVWGKPKFESEAQEQQMQALLQRLFDDITETLQRRRDFEPLVIETEEDGQVVESYEGWCYGFMLGVDQNEEMWEALPKTEQGLLAPMAQLSLLGSEDEEEMSEEEYSQWIELIPGAVMGLYAHWHQG
jgi:uncharacterized protein